MAPSHVDWYSEHIGGNSFFGEGLASTSNATFFEATTALAGVLLRLTVDSIEAIDVSGAVELRGPGEVDTYDLAVFGASDVDLRDLTASEVDIEVDGASELSIWASRSVTGDVSGASEVTVHGDPGNVNVEPSGASDLRMAN